MLSRFLCFFLEYLTLEEKFERYIYAVLGWILMFFYPLAEKNALAGRSL